MRQPPEPLQRFIGLFNRERFWESHEVLEAPWREGRSGFYKGLILFASALVHVQRGNARGVVAQVAKTERELAPYRPVYLGIDVDAVLEAARAIRARVEQAERSGADWAAQVTPPRLVWDAGRVRGDEPELD